MFTWFLKLVALILISGGGEIQLEKTGSTNEAPGIWAEQPGTVPVCASAKDASILMGAYIAETPGIPWSAENSRRQLSVAMSMAATTCHLELLPKGLSEHAFFAGAQFVDILALFPQDEKGAPYIERGIASLTIPKNKFVLLTENEAVVRAYGAIQFEAGKTDGYMEGLADGVNLHQAPPPDALIPEPTAPQARDL